MSYWYIPVDALGRDASLIFPGVDALG